MIRKSSLYDFSLIEIFKIVWDLIYDSPWRKNILDAFEKNVFYIHMLGQFGLQCYSSPLFNINFLIFCWDILYILESGILKSPIIILLYISSICSVNVYVIYLVGLVWYIYLYLWLVYFLDKLILLSSCNIFVSSDFFYFNSILSDTCTATPALFG